MEQFIYFFIALCLTFVLIKVITKNPFRYPYLEISIDISGRRNVKLEDEIDRYLCTYDISFFTDHYYSVQVWKEKCEKRIQRSVFKSLRTVQYQNSIDDDSMFVFSFVREQTRYSQQYYKRTAYKVDNVVDEFKCDLDYIEYRYSLLKQIGFQCTLNEYNAKNQRKLMTKQLREQIQMRDHYTCQICGKYMPDGVGLQIDHIIPVANGGKSIPSNLQVLCSKCNGRKSNKQYFDY